MPNSPRKHGQRGKRAHLLLTLAPLLLALLLPAPAAARSAHGRCVNTHRDIYPLHIGSVGCRVRDLQWLLAGHERTRYSEIHGLRVYKGKVDGQYGKLTARAVKAAKWRLGYPLKYVDTRAGVFLYGILDAQKVRRPAAWIARAAKRVNQRAATRRYTATSCSLRMLRVARGEIGVTEHPWGSNRGYRVSQYQSATGAYGEAWCASFAQWVLKQAGAGPIADRSAGVGYISSFAYRHGWLHSVARPGSLAAFGSEHIGIVEHVYPHYYTSIEGNYANSVMRVVHQIGDRPTVFIWLPWCQ